MWAYAPSPTPTLARFRRTRTLRIEPSGNADLAPCFVPVRGASRAPCIVQTGVPSIAGLRQGASHGPAHVSRAIGCFIPERAANHWCHMGDTAFGAPSYWGH